MIDGTVLLADDDASVRKVISRALTGAGCRVHATALLTTLNRWSAEGKGDLVITDVAMPDGNGIAHLKELRKIRPDLPVIVISAQNTIITAIQAQEAAAFSYLPKPFDIPELLGRVSEGLRHSRRRVSEQPPTQEEELPLVGRAAVMQKLYQSLAKYLNSELPIHLYGETGTGKSLVAQVIHDCSDRRNLPSVNVAAYQLEDPEVAGGLFERAGTGTIFLDEVADLSENAQQILARQLDIRSRGPRVVSCSLRDLSADMAEGRFRKDLFFRLCGVAIEVPSLRQRLDDIPLLTSHFLRQVGRPDSGPSLAKGDLPKQVKAYKWPGNVRELRNSILKASQSVPRDEINWNDITESLHLGQTSLRSDTEPALGALRDRMRRSIEEFMTSTGPNLPTHGLYIRVIREVEGPLILAVLEATAGNRQKCAEILGINRNTLRKKIRELEINCKDQ